MLITLVHPPKAPRPPEASYAYIKWRDIYAGVTVNGMVVNVCQSANTAFHGSAVPVASILRGEVPSIGWKPAVQAVQAAIRAAGAQSSSSCTPSVPTTEAKAVSTHCARRAFSSTGHDWHCGNSSFSC